MDIKNVIALLRKGEEDQIRIERAIGKAILAKLTTSRADDELLDRNYKTLGGDDPVILTVLETMNTELKKLDIKGPREAVTKVAVSDRLAGSHAAKNSEYSFKELTTFEINKNPILNIKGQAISTLAELGGREFSQKYK